MFRPSGIIAPIDWPVVQRRALVTVWSATANVEVVSVEVSMSRSYSTATAISFWPSPKTLVIAVALRT